MLLSRSWFRHKPACTTLSSSAWQQISSETAAHPVREHYLHSSQRTSVSAHAAAAPAPIKARPNKRRAAQMAEPADERLALLRKEMKRADEGKGVDAYIIPTEDAHMSEYPAECDARRAWVSKFTGSAGTAVVTATKAALWTDGRYFLQAEKQLPGGWTLMRGGTPGCPEPADWLASNTEPHARIGIDPFLHTIDGARSLQKVLEEADKQLVPLVGNLVDNVWQSRPAPPQAHLRVHAMEHAGESSKDKQQRIWAECKQTVPGGKLHAVLVTALDEVAWLLNLRGSDVSHNPVFISYAILMAEGVRLYVDGDKVTAEVKESLQRVELRPYEAFLDDVRDLVKAGQYLWADSAKVSFAALSAAREAAPNQTSTKASKRARTTASSNGAAGLVVDKDLLFEKPSPITLAKAIKNKAELTGMQEAHLRDSVALAQTLHWLEQEVSHNGRTITEVEVDDFLTGKRREQPGFVEPSFPTIAGSGPNGAIIHYRAQEGTCADVTSASLLLVDSGGQYDCGTTDVTRTMHMGSPSDHQRLCFTRVLQGHIALDQAVFPEGTHGLSLDTLARAPLWSMGLNYRHGTGHGVGAALNVHEGPHSISFRPSSANTPLQAGMVVSNEPGYYEDGQFGIRIENLLVCEQKPTPFRFAGLASLGFSRLTWCPLQRKMLALEVMSAQEIKWVDSYHQEVLDKVSPRLQHLPEELNWLQCNTIPLQSHDNGVAAPKAIEQVELAKE